MRLCEIWKEQCDAARQIEAEFGTEKALDYLIGEKFLNFLEAVENDAEFRAEIPAFVAEIKSIFEPWQLAEHLEMTRQSKPFDPSDCEDDDAEMVVCEHAGGSFDGCPNRQWETEGSSRSPGSRSRHQRQRASLATRSDRAACPASPSHESYETSRHAW